MRSLALVACGVVALVLAAPPAGAATQAQNYGNRALYLRLAEGGVAQLEQVWWNPQSDWFTTYPYQASWGAGGLATLWDVAPVFEAFSLIALAQPSPANLSALRDVANGAERYFNPDVGGYAYLPGHRGDKNAFFDDNGWWGLDFFDAYRATGDRRYLTDAIRAFRFIDAEGWAADAGGGVWWNTNETKKTSEPLAAEALLGALLYEATNQQAYLRTARKYIAWADAHSWNAARGLYQRNEQDDTVLNYVEGMMIGAHAVLCRALANQSYCNKAEQLAAAAQTAFQPDYHWAPETDAIYLRWLLELYAVDRDPRWYQVADSWAQQAVANARDSRGIFSRRWDGLWASDDRILTPGGTLMLLAAVAAAPGPGS
jgi:uncharacterized protein YyaL (SSP411 family)